MRSEAPACRVRPMKHGDIRQVMEIERQSFPSIWSRTIYERELKNKLARYLVACQPLDDSAPAPPEPGIVGFVRRVLRREPLPRERILGLVGLWCMMGEGHIVTIAVRQEHRRQGIGELLLVAILETALEAGQDGVTLEYRASNHEARALYKKYGFSQVGLRARYYSDNQEDAVLLSTPPLRSSVYQKLIARRVAEQQSRWGESYPLTGALTRLVTPLASG
ncbi:MAG: ribosomal protein S18-alanine N-acetyltransferase [Chloroflexi bacterium]|nr:ribosomal protein S18-alanine N-acetyltransferase [Chloroflexota bacterium]